MIGRSSLWARRPQRKLYGKWFPALSSRPIRIRRCQGWLSDEDFDKLIDNSDARWAEDVYVIDSGSVIDLLRAVEDLRCSAAGDGMSEPVAECSSTDRRQCRHPVERRPG